MVMKPDAKRSSLRIGAKMPSTKLLLLRVPPELHQALVAKAGAEQQRQHRRVSMNTLAATYLAEALGFDVDQED